jgi:hypothetical protein
MRRSRVVIDATLLTQSVTCTAVNCCIAKGLFDHLVGAGDHRNAE